MLIYSLVLSGQVLPGGPQWHSTAESIYPSCAYHEADVLLSQRMSWVCSLTLIIPVSQRPLHRVLLRSGWGCVSFPLPSETPDPDLDLYNHMLCLRSQDGTHRALFIHQVCFSCCSLWHGLCSWHRSASSWCFLVYIQGVLWQYKLLWWAVHHCGQSVSQTQAAGGGEWRRHVCDGFGRVAGQCGGPGEDPHHVLRFGFSRITLQMILWNVLWQHHY